MNGNFNSRMFALLAVVCLALFTAAGASAALTAEQVVKRAASVLSNPSGVSVSFAVDGQGVSTHGTIKTDGNRFAVNLPEVATWYDGKNMWTHNPRTKETTLTVPTAQELLDSNPLLYIKGGAGAYSFSFSKEKKGGKHIVDAVPRNKKSQVKSLRFTINPADWKVEKIEAETSSGKVTVVVKSITWGMKLPAASFTYPTKDYKGVELIDLR